MAETWLVQAIQAGEGMRVGGARKAILPPELVGTLSAGLRSSDTISIRTLHTLHNVTKHL